MRIDIYGYCRQVPTVLVEGLRGPACADPRVGRLWQGSHHLAWLLHVVAGAKPFD